MTIFSECECCQGEGRIYLMQYPRWSEPYEYCIGPCLECEGTGKVEVESEPVRENDEEFFGIREVTP